MFLSSLLNTLKSHLKIFNNFCSLYECNVREISSLLVLTFKLLTKFVVCQCFFKTKAHFRVFNESKNKSKEIRQKLGRNTVTYSEKQNLFNGRDSYNIPFPYGTKG